MDRLGSVVPGGPCSKRCRDGCSRARYPEKDYRPLAEQFPTRTMDRLGSLVPDDPRSKRRRNGFHGQGL
jgi:hypothetical protein